MSTITTLQRGKDGKQFTRSQSSPSRGTSARLSCTNEPLDPSMAIDPALIYRNLWLFIWLKTIGSYDSGAFSAALGADNGIAEEWNLSTVRQGTLTSSVFLGNVIGCPLSGHLLSKYSEKKVLVAALLVHTLFTFLFATFPSYYIALFNRFWIGLTLAFIVVYTPVWVDEFAPKERQSIWMASHNAGVPVGIILGYLLGALFPSYTSISWEWAFYIKCVLMVPTIVYVARVDSRSIDTGRKQQQREQHDEMELESDGERKAGSGTENSPGAAEVVMSNGNGNVATAVPSAEIETTAVVSSLRLRTLALWLTLRPVLTNAVYMCTVIAMCSMYFVATGLQNFVTQYLRGPPFNASMKVIMAGFGAAVVTAPVCGVITGGILLDRCGGYQGNLLRVAAFSLTWATLAASFSVICIFVTTTGAFLVIISIVLFCGGVIIPSGAGLTMASLPVHFRSIGAAFSQTMYNLFGNFSGPMVCGLVSEWTGDLKYGIMTLLLSSTLGVGPLALILFIALREHGGVTTATSIVVTADTEEEEMQINCRSRDEAGGFILSCDSDDVNCSVTRGGQIAHARESERRVECESQLDHRNAMTPTTQLQSSRPRAGHTPFATALANPAPGVVERPAMSPPGKPVRSGDQASGAVRLAEGTFGDELSFSTDLAHCRTSLPPREGSAGVSTRDYISLPTYGSSPASCEVTVTSSSRRARRTELQQQLLIADPTHYDSVTTQHSFGMDVVRSWIDSHVLSDDDSDCPGEEDP